MCAWEDLLRGVSEGMSNVKERPRTADSERDRTDEEGSWEQSCKVACLSLPEKRSGGSSAILREQRSKGKGAGYHGDGSDAGHWQQPVSSVNSLSLGGETEEE